MVALDGALVDIDDGGQWKTAARWLATPRPPPLPMKCANASAAAAARRARRPRRALASKLGVDLSIVTPAGRMA